MNTDISALLARQAGERDAFSKTMDESRAARAWQRTSGERDQPTPHPGGAGSSRADIESSYQRHLHNLAIEDKQRIAALDARHAEERAHLEKDGGGRAEQRKDDTDLGKHRLHEDTRASPKEGRTSDPAPDQTNLPQKPPQTIGAELAHERTTEKIADADRLRAQEILASMAAERDTGRER